MFKSILALESPWDAGSLQSKSVWPFVSEFARACQLSSYYASFSDTNSFCHWVRQFNREKLAEPKLLYVAAHGTSGRIGGLQKDINWDTVINACRRAKNIRFVHVGSCFLGSQKNLEDLLKKAKHIQWAAGYEKDIPWIDSMLFDVMLWARIASRDREDKGVKFSTIAKNLFSEIPGLVTNLGFRFQYRYGGKIKTVSLNSPTPRRTA